MFEMFIFMIRSTIGWIGAKMKQKIPKISKFNIQQQLLYFDLFRYIMTSMAPTFVCMDIRLLKLSEKALFT